MQKEDLTRMMMENQDMPLRDVVFTTLRRAILRGEFQPGERLMEVRLANLLGVSRTPVREAIRMLQLDGLVVNIPRRGAQVASITEKDLRDVLEVREGLEELAVRLACARIEKKQLDELFLASRNFEKIVGSDDLTALAEADEQFHDIIYRATGNERLVQMLNNLREQMYRYRVEYLKDEMNRNSLIREHDDLWKSLKDKDIVGATRCMKQHIDRQMTGVKSRIS